LPFFIRIIHSTKLPGGKKGHQRKAKQIDMADTTGRDYNRFGMSVTRALMSMLQGETNSNVGAAHTVDGDVKRLTPVYVRKKGQGCSAREI
jgi:hypothetical protein